MIFYDSSYLISLFNKKDQYHDDGIEIYHNLSDKTLNPHINTTVVLEVLNSANKYNRLKTNEIFKELESKTNIIMLDYEDLKNSLDLHKYYNHALNFNDCTILNTMNENDINFIISFDRDFDKVKWIKRIYLENISLLDYRFN